MAEPTEFALTADHLKLLRRANIRWEDCEYGAPAVDCKRPYGNSSVEVDVAEILGWPIDERDGLTDEQREAASKVHSETELALQVILITQGFALGRYRRPSPYDFTAWRYVG